MNFDLSNLSGPEFNQGQIGRCAPTTVCTAANMLLFMARKPIVELSNIGLYGGIRLEMGTFNYDSGSTLDATFNVAKNMGIATAAVWSNDPSNLYNRPTPEVYTDAATRKVLGVTALSVETQYWNMQDQVKTYLDQGKGVIMSMMVRDWFMREDGPLSEQVNHYVPGVNSDELRGGHMLMIVGDNDNGTPNDRTDDYAIVKNWWGSTWGDDGYGTIRWSNFSPANHPNDIVGLHVLDGVAGVDVRWTKTREDAAEMYAFGLGRAGDKDGIVNMARELEGGKNPVDCLDWMLGTQEGLIQFPPSWSNQQKADKIYMMVCGRHADAQGGANMAAALDAGWTVGACLMQTMNAIDEYKGSDLGTILEARRYDNRTHISQYYGITMQGEGEYSTEALAGVTADRNTVEIAKIGIHEYFQMV